MKRITWNDVWRTLIVVLVLVSFSWLLSDEASASDGMPPDVIAWEYAGELFVTDYDEDGHPRTQHICPCDVKPTPKPTDKPQPTPTDKPRPTPTPKSECKIWLCHKPGTPAEQNYCCYDSEGCKSAHLGHGDYLGKCK